MIPAGELTRRRDALARELTRLRRLDKVLGEGIALAREHGFAADAARLEAKRAQARGDRRTLQAALDALDGTLAVQRARRQKVGV